MTAIISIFSMGRLRLRWWCQGIKGTQQSLCQCYTQDKSGKCHWQEFDWPEVVFRNSSKSGHTKLG